MIKIEKKGLAIKEDKVLAFYSADITSFGNSAKIGCQKKYIGKKAVVVILDEESKND